LTYISSHLILVSAHNGDEPPKDPPISSEFRGGGWTPPNNPHRYVTDRYNPLDLYKNFFISGFRYDTKWDLRSFGT